MVLKKVLPSLQAGLIAVALTLIAAPGFGQTVSQPASATQPSNPTLPATVASVERSAVFADSWQEVSTPHWLKPDNEEAEASPRNNSEGGFKMHGHWIIDVKNPDGTLAERRDFENALQPTGASFIFGLLAGYYNPGDYVILLTPQSGNGACGGNALQAQGCTLLRSTANPALSFYCTNYTCATGLTYTLNRSGGGYNSFTLSGAITATQAGTIGSVSTIFDSCSVAGSSPTSIIVSNSTAAACQNGTGAFINLSNTLSLANITAIALTPGQLVQVTVTITFS